MNSNNNNINGDKKIVEKDSPEELICAICLDVCIIPLYMKKNRLVLVENFFAKNA